MIIFGITYLYFRFIHEPAKLKHSHKLEKGEPGESEATSSAKRSNSELKVAGVRAFTKEELAEATDNFSDANVIGQGGYGQVYRGQLPDGKRVAIKAADPKSGQGAHEFYTEIAFLSRVHHKNLVRLEGYCDVEDHQMLVYEFMPSGTLQDHLSACAEHGALDFPSRVRIALGSARGILYLHTEANPPIFHRDIKASNILLDSRGVAKVADFGLSCLAPVPDTEGVTPGYVSTMVKGTPGYLDPEYYMTQKLTDKSDVYSFGVVLLELLTGKHAITNGKNIVREVNKRLVVEGNTLALVDPYIADYAQEALESFMRLGLRCCREMPEKRPTMAEVVSELEQLSKCNHIDTATFSTDLMTPLKKIAPLPCCKPSRGPSLSGGVWCDSVMEVSTR